MICPECLAKFLDAVPRIGHEVVTLVPGVGPFAAPVAEAVARAVIRVARDDELGQAAKADLPDQESVVRRLLEELEAESEPVTKPEGTL